MKLTFNYAIEMGSEVPAEIQADVMQNAWEEMELEAKRNRSRVDIFSNYILEEPLMTVEGMDYAIMAISEHPRAVVVYDYWKCIEVLLVRDGMSEDEAIEALDVIMADYTDDGEPLFIQPFEFDEDEYSDDDGFALEESDNDDGQFEAVA